MDKIDSRPLPVEALNERRRRAVKMRLDGVSLEQTAAHCELSRTTVIAADLPLVFRANHSWGTARLGMG
jgi:hypothetical protein